MKKLINEILLLENKKISYVFLYTNLQIYKNCLIINKFIKLINNKILICYIFNKTKENKYI